MKLEDLKKEMPYKWRVQQANQYGANCVAYIDARDVQDRLDEVCGAMNWQVVYEEYKGNLFAKICIRNLQMLPDRPLQNKDKNDFADWVCKSDCGTESNVEKQKGEASDAFKRAAVMWGVGRFLYHKPIIKLESIQKNGKWVASFNGQALYGDKVTDACNYKLKQLEK